MKKEFYVSWCKGIAKDKRALSLIKKSGIIKGIEMSALNEEIDLIKKSGLKVNIHNPSRKFYIGLENKDLIKKIGFDNIPIFKKNDENFIGIHVCFFRKYAFPFSFLIDENVKKNVEYLRKNTGHKIIFENPPFALKYGKFRKNASSSKFIKKILRYTDGYLFDIPHNFITFKTLGKGGDKYRKELLEITKGKVLELHLSCPNIKNNEYLDGHIAFKGRNYEKEVLDFAKEVIKLNPQMKVIALEIDGGSNPVEHAKLLIGQVRYLKKNLQID